MVKQQKDTEKTSKRARGIDRLVDILEYLHECGRPQRANDIATGIGAPKSSVYEIVNRLVDANILEVFDDQGRLFLGRKLHFYGLQYLEKFDLLRDADPIVEALSDVTGETAQLCMCDGNKYIVALAHAGARHFKISSDLGRPIPLTWTASGRLLLADMSESEILDFLAEDDFIMPNGSNLSPETFFEEIAMAKKAEYYSCNSVVDEYTRCYAAPIRDQTGACIAALCLVTPRDEGKRRDNELREALVLSAAKLTASLSGRR